MCGICGVVAFDGVSRDYPGIIEKMNHAIAHRGPDDEGYLLLCNNVANLYAGRDTVPYNQSNSYLPKKNIWEADKKAQVALGHRRLSILDVTPAGHQPMGEEQKNYWIVYNGEVYNYLELKTQLQQLGYAFYSSCDTEVVLKAFMHWGESCVNHFDGMWSFAIMDVRNQKLFCARDRFGVKPFYYSVGKSVFMFASEIKSLLASGQINPYYDTQVMAGFLKDNETVLGDKTLFDGLKELPAGCSLSLSLKTNSLEVKTYYKAELLPKEEGSLSFSQAKDGLLKHLQTSVRLRSRSDVPLGVCLSGGLDSSVLLTLLSEQLGESSEIQSFTAVSPGYASDESKWAKIMAEHTGSKWNCSEINPEYLVKDFSELIRVHEVPIISFSTYAQYCVMEKVSQQGIKVVLNGQGADELLGGYPQYFYFQLLSNLGNFKIKQSLDLLHVSNQNTSSGRMVKDFFKWSFFPSLPPAIFNAFRLKYYPDLKFVRNDFLKDHQNQEINKGIWGIQNAMRRDFSGSYLQNLLRYEDKNSMRFGVESRVPFADSLDLINFGFKIPTAYKIKGVWPKYVLRKAMEEKMPQAITWRNLKMGFTAPNNAWLKIIAPTYKNQLEYLPRELFDRDVVAHSFKDFFSPSSEVEDFRRLKIISLIEWFKQTHSSDNHP